MLQELEEWRRRSRGGPSLSETGLLPQSDAGTGLPLAGEDADRHRVSRRDLRISSHEAAGGRSAQLYGDLHRFIPIIARTLGFRVTEVNVEQHDDDRPTKLYGPAVYSRRILDILTVFFLVNFTRRPLRFFGLIGLGLLVVGGGITLYLGIYRLLGMGGIADRPLLLLGILLAVLGFQSISIGLLGELIIYTHARKMRTYRIAEEL